MVNRGKRSVACSALAALLCVACLAAPGAQAQTPGLLGSTFFPGASVKDVATDAAGAMYVTGSADPRGFPTTPGAFDETGDTDRFLGDAFVAKLSQDGSA